MPVIKTIRNYGWFAFRAALRILPELLVLLIAIIAFFTGLFPPVDAQSKAHWMIFAAGIFFVVVISRYIQELTRISGEIKAEERLASAIEEGNRRSSELVGVISALAGGAVRVSTRTFANNALEFGDRILHYAFESRPPWLLIHPTAHDLERARLYNEDVIKQFKTRFGRELEEVVDGLLLAGAELPRGRDFYLNPKRHDDLNTIAGHIMIASHNLRSREDRKG